MSVFKSVRLVRSLGVFACLLGFCSSVEGSPEVKTAVQQGPLTDPSPEPIKRGGIDEVYEEYESPPAEAFSTPQVESMAAPAPHPHPISPP